jgi:hypothetical protein
VSVIVLMRILHQQNGAIHYTTVKNFVTKMLPSLRERESEKGSGDQMARFPPFNMCPTSRDPCQSVSVF